MPTLIRLLVFLLVLAGLAFGGMVALVAFVDPGAKEVRVRIPTSDLMVNNNGDPLNIRDQLPTPSLTDEPATPPPSTETTPTAPVTIDENAPE